MKATFTLTVGTEITLGNTEYKVVRVTEKAVLLGTGWANLTGGYRNREDWLPLSAMVPYKTWDGRTYPNWFELAPWWINKQRQAA